MRFWDKLRALEALAKHFGLLVERVEHSVSGDLTECLQAARLRGKSDVSGLLWLAVQVRLDTLRSLAHARVVPGHA